MNLNGLKINFLGDSITEGCKVSSPDKYFTSVIASEYGAITRNYGIGGTRIARQKNPSENARWDRDFCSRVEEMDPDADVIVVFGGTNDFGHGDAAMGDFSDRTPYTFYGALHTLYSSLIEKYPAAIIMIITPLHRPTEDDPLNGGRKTEGGAPLIDYVRAIRRTAEYYSLPVLDLYATGGMQPIIEVQKKLFSADGLHPNDAGHARIAARIAKFLENNF